MHHNSRNKLLSVKEAEGWRRSIFATLELPESEPVESSRIAIAYMLRSYLDYRNPDSNFNANTFVTSCLEADSALLSRLEHIALDYDVLGYLVDYVYQYKLANQQDHLDGNGSKRKAQGAFYTPFHIAEHIVQKTLPSNKSGVLSTLDPACGTGVFLSACASFMIRNGHTLDEILVSLHAWDKDLEALRICQLLLIGELALNSAQANTLIQSPNFVAQDSLLSLESSDLFSSQKDQKTFEYIVANPPYDRLKPDNLSEDAQKEMKRYIGAIRDSRQYPLSSSGSLELYRLFIERIINLLSFPLGKAGLIVPLTFTNDKSAQALREKILAEEKLLSAVLIPERARAFDGVSQAFCILEIGENISGKVALTSCDNARTLTGRSNQVDIQFLREAFPNSRNIINLSSGACELLAHLSKFPTLKSSPAIKNRRGECDLTFNRDLLGKGDPRLLRGKGLAEYQLKGFDLIDSDAFLTKVQGTEKHTDIFSYRIACQQISNMDAKKRLKFALIEPGAILGNSLNYISINSSSRFAMLGLLGVMNSLLLDWRFRITSSNNHVNNYELDDLPLPKDMSSLIELGQFVDANWEDLKDEQVRCSLEHKVLALFNAQSFFEVLQTEHPLADMLHTPFVATSAHAREVMYA